MKPENRDLKEIFQAYAESRRPGGRGPCPSVETLADSFAPGASARTKKEIIDHLSECPACREEFRLYLDLQKIPIDALPNTHSSGNAPLMKPRRLVVSPSWRYAFVALGFSLILISIVFFLHTPEIPEADRAGVAEISLVSPMSSPILKEDLIFRWKAFPQSQYYIVELFDEALLPIWTSPPVYDLQVRPPSEKIRALHSGKAYFWMVTSFTEAAKAFESRLARFEIITK